MRKVERKQVKCQKCGKTFAVRLKEQKKFCGKNCYWQDKVGKPNGKKRTGKLVKCLLCGKEVYKPKGQIDGRNHFCSLICANKYQSRNKIGVKCLICGKEFLCSKSHNYKYCSIACRDKDPEVIKMLIELNAKQNRMKKETSIERIGYKLLNELNIFYKKQYLINDKFCVDAFLPNEKLIIQFDGDYWHGYRKNIFKVESRIQKRMKLDISQDAYLKKCGYKVLRFWEHDLLKANEEFIYEHIKRTIQ